MNPPSEHPAIILAIEDNPADIYLLRHALDQHGEEYEMEVIDDGEEAINFVNRQRKLHEAKPCVIVLDLHLPKHDGKAVLEAIRQEPLLAHIQVVALTSVAAPADEDQVRELGVSIYTAKPTHLDDWIMLAGRILEICREDRSPVLV